MKGFFVKSFSVFVAALLLIGCSDGKVNPVAKGATVGAATGTVAGAGTGALIASLIPAGDVAASALLGGGIGLPVGMVLGAYYVSTQQDDEIDLNSKSIEKNRMEIERRQGEIESLREKLLTDSSDIRPDTTRKEYQYQGHSLGNYYR
jgi:phage tail tape-measure protein